MYNLYNSNRFITLIRIHWIDLYTNTKLITIDNRPSYSLQDLWNVVANSNGYMNIYMQKYIQEYELKLSIVTHDLMSKPQPTFSYPLETSTINQPTNHFCIEYFFFIYNYLQHVIYNLFIRKYWTRSRLTTIIPRNWWT